MRKRFAKGTIVAGSMVILMMAASNPGARGNAARAREQAIVTQTLPEPATELFTREFEGSLPSFEAGQRRCRDRFSHANGQRGGVIWTDEDWNGSAGAIAQDVAISKDGAFVLVAWNLNYQRLSCYSTTGDGTPLWECDMLEGGTYNSIGKLSVATSFDGQTTASAIGYRQHLPDALAASFVMRFTPASATPLWTFALPTTEDGLATSEYAAYIAVSTDGSTIAALASNQAPEPYHVYVFAADDSTPRLTITLDPSEFTSCSGIAVTADGSRLAVDLSASSRPEHKTRVFNLADGQLLQEITNNFGTTQCPPALSADGSYLAIGDLHGKVIVYHYDSGTSSYSESWRYAIPPGAYYPWVNSVAISDDNRRLAIASYEATQSENKGYGYLFDLDNSTPIWQSEDAGDYAGPCAISSDGGLAVYASWGDYGAQHGYKLLTLDCNQLSVLFKLDFSTPGSFFACAVDAAGAYVTGGSKRVHARDFGSGGIAYAIGTGYLSPTPGPSPTITPSPTSAPTDTPAATATPAASPTLEPTAPQSPTPTASATPTATPGLDPFVDLSLNQHEFSGGDHMIVSIVLLNPDAEVMVDLYIVLFIAPDLYLFLTAQEPFPSFNEQITPITFPLPTEFAFSGPLLDFLLPQNPGVPITGIWYAGLFAAGTGTYFGGISAADFMYN